jgi:hypothetical protein
MVAKLIYVGTNNEKKKSYTINVINAIDKQVAFWWRVKEIIGRSW